MGRKAKFSFEVKLNSVLMYKRGEISQCAIAQQLGADEKSIRQWLMIYDSQGADGLKETHHNRSWSSEIKQCAVLDYLSGNSSMFDICQKYKISTTSLLRQWIMVYNDSHKELKSTGSGRNKPMTKGRKVTFDEKIDIVHFCIANGKDYYAAMDKYNVSYQQVYAWVRKYEQNGADALIDRRGKAKPENELTELDKLRIENKRLAAENHRIEMENAILKKLQEIERRRR